MVMELPVPKRKDLGTGRRLNSTSREPSPATENGRFQTQTLAYGPPRHGKRVMDRRYSSSSATRTTLARSRAPRQQNDRHAHHRRQGCKSKASTRTGDGNSPSGNRTLVCGRCQHACIRSLDFEGMKYLPRLLNSSLTSGNHNH